MATDQFNEEKQNVLRAMRNSNDSNVTQNAVNAVNKAAWESLYTAFYNEVMLDFGKRTLSSYKSRALEVKISAEDNPFEDLLFEVNEFIEETTQQRSQEVTDTTKDRITETIAALLLAGSLLSEIEEAIAELYDHDTPIRSRAIAQTEVITAGNAATFFVATGLGGSLAEKQWNAVIDDRTRESHRQINGETVSIVDTYSNGLRFPGDPRGSAEDVINCRCIETYLF